MMGYYRLRFPPLSRVNGENLERIVQKGEQGHLEGIPVDVDGHMGIIRSVYEVRK